MKKIAYISIWLTAATAIMVLLSFALKNHNTVKCHKISISISDTKNPGFINQDDISKIIVQNFDSIIGICIDSINTEMIETTLIDNPYIKNVEIFKSVTGEVEIYVEPHTPLARIINKDGESFYLSTNGCILPFSNKFTPRVIVVSGFIDEKYQISKEMNFKKNSKPTGEESMLSSIHYLSGELSKHEYLNKYIEQIFINKKGEIELVPANGNHIILVGNINNIQRKLSNLMAFYRAGTSASEQNYRSLNLKYINQVICKK